MREKMNRYINIITPFAVLEAYLVIRLLHDVRSEFKFWERGLVPNLLEFVGFVATAYLLIITIHLIRAKVPAEIPNAKSLFKRHFLQLFIVIVIGKIIVGLLGAFLLNMFYGEVTVANLLLIYIISMSYAAMYWMTLTGVNYMVSYSEAKLKTKRLSKEKTEAELLYLKSQINPHTLFNVINNIYFLMDEDVAKAKTALSTYSDMLSYQLYDCEDKLISLSGEIGYIEDNIVIERIRREQLNVDLKIGSLEFQKQIPPFILLPFIENAFKHLGGDNSVEISIHTTKTQILFAVKNSLEHIGKTHNTWGIGLKNVNKRLDLLFPDRYKLDVTKSDKNYNVILELTYNED